MELSEVVLVECQGESADSCAGCVFRTTDDINGCRKIREALGLPKCFERGTIFQVKSGDKSAALSLRDEIAIAALPAIIAKFPLMARMCDVDSTSEAEAVAYQETIMAIARGAYSYADCLLTVRKEQ